jgi:regulator of RNase E activity RraA
MSKVGFRIFTEVDRPDPALVERFRGIPSSNINDMMNRLYNTDSSIKLLNSVGPLLGVAFTVKAPLGDNAMFHRAMDLAQPGDVLVVDGGGCEERSLAGEMMMTYAAKKGIAGWVVNGALRDLGGIKDCPIPIYGKCITPQGPYKNGPGEINVPVCCGGVAVLPGDIVVGDEDGVVFIRKDDAPYVIEKAIKKFAAETKKLKQYEEVGLQGNNHEAEWISALEEKGVEYIDG